MTSDEEKSMNGRVERAPEDGPAGNSFFEEQREASAVKTAIVTKYFSAWAGVIVPWAKQTQAGKVGYIDLYCGPGRYADGAKSTPIMILEKAIADADLRNMLVTIFNDKDDAHAKGLREAIAAIPGIDRLKHAPSVYNDPVNDEMAKRLESMRLVPSLIFIDPWGYKGLSLRLINAVLKDWGCDCIFFFNFTRVNMGLTNEFVRDHLDSIFGADRAEALRLQVEGMTPPNRAATVLNALAEALRDKGGRYVLPFSFRRGEEGRLTHHLIFVSKHVRGYTIMKNIMAGESSGEEDGVPSFSYFPTEDARQAMLFPLTRHVDTLGDDLLARFAGRTLTVQQVFDQHQVGTPFVITNYQEALRRLEAAGIISVDVPADKRRKLKTGIVTLGKDRKISFPAVRRG